MISTIAPFSELERNRLLRLFSAFFVFISFIFILFQRHLPFHSVHHIIQPIFPSLVMIFQSNWLRIFALLETLFYEELRQGGAVSVAVRRLKIDMIPHQKKKESTYDEQTENKTTEKYPTIEGIERKSSPPALFDEKSSQKKKNSKKKMEAKLTASVCFGENKVNISIRSSQPSLVCGRSFRKKQNKPWALIWVTDKSTKINKIYLLKYTDLHALVSESSNILFQIFRQTITHH